jgi:thiamine phosphate synthase YjbQ (UPF0047 family)
VSVRKVGRGDSRKKRKSQRKLRKNSSQDKSVVRDDEDVERGTRDVYVPHTRSSATMRDAESLVEVEMNHIRANTSRRRKSDHCVHIGA